MSLEFKAAFATEVHETQSGYIAIKQQDNGIFTESCVLLSLEQAKLIAEFIEATIAYKNADEDASSVEE